MLQCLQLADVITSEQYKLYEVRSHASQHSYDDIILNALCVLITDYVIDFT